MVPLAYVRQFATNQQIDLDVADQEIVLHYMLGLLAEAGLMGKLPGQEPGALLFKGGTALRKCVFGQTGRFSQDIDVDAMHENGFEALIENMLLERSPYYGITFTIPGFRYTESGNFSGSIAYRHASGDGAFELQISYRLEPILDPTTLTLAEQTYFQHVEFPPPALYGLDPIEMIAEKIMACNRRRGGSAKDVYDLFLWSRHPFNHDLVRRVTVLKAWTDPRTAPRYEPNSFLETVRPANYRWEDLDGLVPRHLDANRNAICENVRTRFGFLSDCTAEEQIILGDQSYKRERRLFEELKAEAQEWSEGLF